jgi:hypothetical protein
MAKRTRNVEAPVVRQLSPRRARLRYTVADRAPTTGAGEEQLGGPVLLAAKIDDKPGIGQTVRDPALIRNRFMRGLGTGRGTALDA